MRSGQKSNRQNDANQEDSNFVINTSILVQKLGQQSVRWLHISITLLSLIVCETHRNANASAVAQFLEVIIWRAQGKVTEEEFTGLYLEWMQHANSSSHPSDKSRKKGNISIHTFRSILLEKNCTETDLDLYVGMMIHELNSRLINTTLSYGGKRSGVVASAPVSFALETVTAQWLVYSEELFFALDSPGYGTWRFDEAFFFCACAITGLQGWGNEYELEADLALPSLTAITLQFMRDAGAHHSSSIHHSIHSDSREGFKEKSKPIAPERVGINVAMFKRYLIRKGLSESDLSCLLQHVRFCIDKLARVAKVSGAKDLYSSQHPLEYRDGVVGSPRLWQEAALIATGFQNQTQVFGASKNALSPVVMFLLSEAESAISGVFRALEFPTDGSGFVADTPHVEGTLDLANPLFSVSAANDEMQDVVNRMFLHFRSWNAAIQNIPTKDAIKTGGQNDPVHHVILNTLLQYKTLQKLLNAALFDFCVAHYGESAVSSNVKPGQLSIVCASVTPNARDMLVELGFEDKETISSHAMDSMEMNSQSEMKAENEVIIEPPTESPPPPPPKLTQRQSMLVEAPMDGGAVNNVSKISQLPLAERRRSSLMLMAKAAEETKQSKPALPSQQPIVMETPMSEKPNYFKPTSSYLAKHEVERKEELEDPEDIPAPPPPRQSAVRRQPDPAISQVKWQALLDMRQSSSIPAVRTSHERPPPQQPLSKEGMVLKPEESEILAQLLLVTDAVEQLRLIEELKKIRNSGSAEPPPKMSVDAVKESPLRFNEVDSPISISSTPPKQPPMVDDNSEASSVPSTIQELLEQGQNPGKYAQMLREILRKMSRDDSNVRLKSLEQVLQLGQNIVRQDVEEKQERQKKSAVAGAGNVVTSPQRTPLMSPAASNKQTGDQPRSVVRNMRAPGVMPDNIIKKPQKVFGHPVDT